jgi:hypothetical protein
MIFLAYMPEVFQGSLNMKNYFEGWYFKHVSANLKQAYSFIPGISLSKNESHAFIQIINGSDGSSEYIPFRLKEFSWKRTGMYIKIGKSIFTSRYIQLNINNGRLKVNGRIEYSNMVHYPKNVLSPGIMGWYSFVPFMECKHGVVSVTHDLSGEILMNGTMIDFYDGKGYIEKDWGTSFPESWLWVQANNFNDYNTSFHFSVAKIPWLGKFFIGFISFLYFGGKFYRFNTYDGSSISELYRSGRSVYITMGNKDHKLRVKVVRRTAGELKAPVSGSMSRRIKESIDARVSLALYDSEGKVIYTDTSLRAGFEQIDKIFEYFGMTGTEQSVEKTASSEVPLALE